MERAHRNETDFIINRIVNENAVGGGTLLPRQLAGETRVPIISNLRVVKSNSYFGGTQFTISWSDPPVQTRLISHFNIYVTGLLENNAQPLGPFTARRSPAQVRVQADSARPVVFTVQTVLLNGQASDMGLSPSITGQTIAPALVASDFTTGSVPIAALATGTAGNIITWDGGGVAIEATPGSIDIVLGSSNLVTPGRLVVVTSSGVLDEVKHYSIDNTDSPYAVPNDAIAIFADTTTADVEVDLPAAASWSSRPLIIKNTGTGANFVTIDPNGSETLDDNLTVDIRALTSLAILCDGSNWFIT